VLRPSLLVSVLVVVAIAGAVLPRLIGYGPYGHEAIERQIEREDGSLCAKYGMVPGTERGNECKAALADLRRQHELLLQQ